MMKRGIHAEVYSHSKLKNAESVKAACDTPIFPSYRVNPHSEDSVSEERDQYEVDDCKGHRLSATEAGRLAWGN